MAEHDDRRVLIHAPIGRDGLAAADLMSRAGLLAVSCHDLREVLAHLRAGAASAFIAEEGLFGQDLDELSGWVRRQPAWSDLPFVILTSHHEHPVVAAWRRELVERLRNVAMLERPVHPITLTSTMQATVRARLKQYEIRDLLAARDQAARELEALVVVRTRELDRTNAELRQQIEQRARAEATLRRTQKLEAVGQLTGGVAHDFNNLLMVISGGLDMLGRKDNNELRQLLLKEMRHATDRGAALTRQLLAFSRRQVLQPEPVDLRVLLGGMRELLERSLGGQAQVTMAFATDLWCIQVDPGELELVILNLAVNARDAMPQGGRIEIHADNAPGIEQQGARGDFVRLCVSDSGTGMPPDVLERVFEPFFTTKEVGKGSGLGLAQVYGFAQQSGGGVQIDSTPGEGTRVCLTLPRSDGVPKVAAADGDAVGAVTAEPSHCVLLVEDNDAVATVVTEMLGELRHQVIPVANAADALRVLENGREIDVVFSDIMMPGGMNGIDLAREVRRRRPAASVLLTSGHHQAASRNGEEQGVSILPKPYQLHELAAAIRAAVQH